VFLLWYTLLIACVFPIIVACANIVARDHPEREDRSNVNMDNQYLGVIPNEAQSCTDSRVLFDRFLSESLEVS